uniref:Uncharacterized protein n=1 Tax=viral metagenome TaxID=1070528 RepID=A0A6C0D620_9ZZZZ
MSSDLFNSYFEAYEKPSSHVFEKSENPQVYDRFIQEYQSDTPKRHILGIVGGNEVYEIKGNRVDLESDLIGITRPNTRGTERKHQLSEKPDSIKRDNPKEKIDINATPVTREEFQMWSYPVVHAPLAFKKESCMPKNKF